MKPENNSRREFLLTGLLAAGAVAGCSSTNNPFEGYAGDDIKASGEKIKLLSVDGEIIEVDRAFIKAGTGIAARF